MNTYNNNNKNNNKKKINIEDLTLREIKEEINNNILSWIESATENLNMAKETSAKTIRDTLESINKSVIETKETSKEPEKTSKEPENQIYYVYLNPQGKVVTDKNPPPGYNIDSSKITVTHVSTEDFKDPLFTDVIQGKTFKEVIDIIADAIYENYFLD